MLGRLSSDDVATWLARASIYVLPARYEPFGLSALEAALAGCALVLGDIASLREVWDDAAVFVAPGDAVMLEGKIRCLIGDSAYRTRMAGRARKRALEYSPARMCASYLHLYRSAAAGRACLRLP
jgi:glycosyltransferase involved in cell wall biosynthesis